MKSIIDRHTKIGEAQDILRKHGLTPTPESDILLSLLVKECDHLEIEGSGSSASITKIVTPE